jgi:hypothetical protein
MALILDRGKISARDAFRIVTSVMKLSGSNMKVSYTSLVLLRKRTRLEEATFIRQQFRPKGPLTVHFDGIKMCPLAGDNGITKVERLPVVITGTSFIH